MSGGLLNMGMTWDLANPLVSNFLVKIEGGRRAVKLFLTPQQHIP